MVTKMANKIGLKQRNCHFGPNLWFLVTDCFKNEISEQLNTIISFNMLCAMVFLIFCLKIVSEYDQEIPQSQTADNPVAPRGRAAQPSRDTRRTN